MNHRVQAIIKDFAVFVLRDFIEMEHLYSQHQSTRPRIICTGVDKRVEENSVFFENRSNSLGFGKCISNDKMLDGAPSTKYIMITRVAA